MDQRVHILEICAKLSKKLKSIKAIYSCSSERPHHALSENNLATVQKILSNKTSKKVLTQQKFIKIHQIKTLISSKLSAIA